MVNNQSLIWEFFAGSRSFSNVCENRGYDTYTSDIEPFDRIDEVVDFLEFDVQKALLKTGKPSIIWFSPPCKYFSVASCSIHWDYDGLSTYTPKSKGALIGLKILKKINQIIEELEPDYFIIENPRGLMRKMKELKQYKRNTAWYCRYNHKNAKPTDIWTNFNLELRVCKNGNKECHHEKAPRGSKSGTQGLKNSFERSKVPKELCLSIIKQIENNKSMVNKECECVEHDGEFFECELCYLTNELKCTCYDGEIDIYCRECF